MKYAITGGAGFIGSNTAARLIHNGEEVLIIDNLSRKGSEINLAWLKSEWGDFHFEQIDVRDESGLARTFTKYGPFDRVFHFAGQVAVTTSVESPREDFESNALGTLNVLEGIRSLSPEAILLYSSTNKVYGALEHLGVEETDTRYLFGGGVAGVSEKTPLDFYSPYGCSKGAADQYVRDYARIYDLATIVFRNSCIYGPRQFGIEDQGWVAWFVIAALLGKDITIYGNGKQVRDVLHIDDLIDAMLMAMDHREATAGEIYNIGGGPANTISIWMEFGPLLEATLNKTIEVKQGDWRPGDQPIYVSDIRKANADFGWSPKVGVEQGIQRLASWIHDNRALFT